MPRLRTLSVLTALLLCQCKPANKQVSDGKTLGNAVAPAGAGRDQPCGINYDGQAALRPLVRYLCSL